MKNIFLVLMICLVLPTGSFGQKTKADTIWVGKKKDGTILNGNVAKRTPSSAKWADGYIVYNGDTIKGLITMYRFELFFQKPINQEYSYYYAYEKSDPNLSRVMMYNNKDKKPLCLTRVRPNDKELMRVIHEGKLNVYDDRTAYVYDPHDIDKNLIVVEYEGVVDDLSSFFTVFTKRDLIGYINDAYGIKINPQSLSWPELLVKLDALD